MKSLDFNFMFFSVSEIVFTSILQYYYSGENQPLYPSFFTQAVRLSFLTHQIPLHLNRYFSKHNYLESS